MTIRRNHNQFRARLGIEGPTAAKVLTVTADEPEPKKGRSKG